VGQEGLEVLRAELLGVPLAVEEDELAGPADVRLLGAGAVVMSACNLAHPLQEP
jgi:hypothetical protein